MINEKSREALRKATFSKNFCRPLYGSYCFSRIPETIKALLGIPTTEALPTDTYQSDQYEHVILLFLDGFGWKFFDQYKAKFPILQKLEQEGIASQLTSMFPSTTAAHVTCIHTNLSPCQSGLYEWFIYEPKLNEIIAPLPFSFAGQRQTDALPLHPKELFPQKSLYHTLADNGITSYAFQPAPIADSFYSKAVLSGANIVGYHSLAQAFEQILTKRSGKTYSFLYYSDIDSIGHRKGTASKDFEKPIKKICQQIEPFFNKLSPKTALIVTADHGMTDVFPDKTYYLNEHILNIEKYLLFGKKNKPLVPAGSCRDFFLHVREENLNELKEILTEFLDGKAEVYLTQELIENQFFGSQAPSQKFLNRVGNLLILPYQGEAIWWHEKKHFEQNFHAAHGGLTREEMEIPFLFYRT